MVVPVDIVVVDKATPVIERVKTSLGSLGNEGQANVGKVSGAFNEIPKGVEKASGSFQSFSKEIKNGARDGQRSIMMLREMIGGISLAILAFGDSNDKSFQKIQQAGQSAVITYLGVAYAITLLTKGIASFIPKVVASTAAVSINMDEIVQQARAMGGNNAAIAANIKMLQGQADAQYASVRSFINFGQWFAKWGEKLSIVGASIFSIIVLIKSLTKESEAAAQASADLIKSLTELPNFDFTKRAEQFGTVIERNQKRVNELTLERATLLDKTVRRSEEEQNVIKAKIKIINEELIPLDKKLIIQKSIKEELDKEIEKQNAIKDVTKENEQVSGKIQLGKIKELEIEQKRIIVLRDNEITNEGIFHWNQELVVIEEQLRILKGENNKLDEKSLKLAEEKAKETKRLRDELASAITERQGAELISYNKYINDKLMSEAKFERDKIILKAASVKEEMIINEMAAEDEILNKKAAALAGVTDGEQRKLIIQRYNEDLKTLHAKTTGDLIKIDSDKNVDLLKLGLDYAEQSLKMYDRIAEARITIEGNERRKEISIIDKWANDEKVIIDKLAKDGILSHKAVADAKAEIDKVGIKKSENVGSEFDKELLAVQKWISDKKALIDKQEEDGLITHQNAINSKMNIDVIAKQKEKNASSKRNENVSLILQQMTDEKAAIDEKEKSGIISHEAAEAAKNEIDEIAAQKRTDVNKKADMEIISAIQDISKQGINMISQFVAQSYQAKISGLERDKQDVLGRYDAEMSAIDTTTEMGKRRAKDLNDARTRAEEDYNKKISAAKLQAWRAERDAKLAMAAIDTAKAVIVALGGGPPPFNLALAVITAAAAAAQTALIASQPEPRFHKGGKMFFDAPENAETSIRIRGGETVRVNTPEQETSTVKSKDNVVNIIFNSPIPHGEWIKKSVEEGLRRTGLTVDRFFVKNINDLSLVN